MLPRRWKALELFNVRHLDCLRARPVGIAATLTYSGDNGKRYRTRQVSGFELLIGYRFCWSHPPGFRATSRAGRMIPTRTISRPASVLPGIVIGDGKTAVRGAFGIFYDTINTDSIAQENPPFVGGRRALTNGNLTNPFTSVGATAPPAFVDPSAFTFTFPISGLFSTQKRNRATTYMNSWNFTVQRQLAQTWMVSGAYIGKSGLKLLAYRPFNAAIYVPGPDAQGRPLRRKQTRKAVFRSAGVFTDRRDTTSTIRSRVRTTRDSSR